LRATDELEQTAERLAAPIVKALLGKAAVPDDSPYTTGSIGLLGTRPSQEAMRHRPNAHATISGNSSRQNAPPCDPARSFMTTSASAPRSASAHLLAFSRKNGS
jgi:Thiamine pyrophosphate enzyme, central domain